MLPVGWLPFFAGQRRRRQWAMASSSRSRARSAGRCGVQPIVATNDPCHVEPTLVALEYGKPVLVEKPLCQSVDDA